MSIRLSMPMTRRPKALRLHSLPAEGVQPAGEREQRSYWLLSLREAAVREAHRHAELEACLDALKDAVTAVPVQVQQNLQQVTALAVEVGLTVAREVVGDVLDSGAVDPSPTVRRCLEEATAGLVGQNLEVRLHPEDLSLVMAELDRDPAMRERIERSHFIPEPSMSRAAVRIDTDAGRLHYDHREVLQRISQELRNTLGGDLPPDVEAASDLGSPTEDPA